MNVTSNKQGAHLEVRAEGEVDLYSSPALRKAVLDAVAQAESGVRVVLSQVAYMDSSGVATLVEGLRAARDAGKSFSLSAPSGPVMKVLQLARLDAIFTIEDNTMS